MAGARLCGCKLAKRVAPGGTAQLRHFSQGITLHALGSLGQPAQGAELDGVNVSNQVSPSWIGSRAPWLD
eukprot:scaffold34482_cov24-Prasinocladus_malaysianus.AAC.1